MYQWDATKRRANLAKHGVDFAEIERFDWPGAIIEPDERRIYGELRFMAHGLIGQRLYMVTYTWRLNQIRLISLRKANRREVLKWKNSD